MLKSVSIENKKISFKNMICEKCNFKCNQKCDWNRHINSKKHKNLNNDLNILFEKKIICKCGKIYKHTSSLYKHRKQCRNIEKEETEEIKETEENMIKEILKQNSILIQQNNNLKNIIINQNNDFKNIIINQNKIFQEKLLQIIE
jgi:hypothetical protein